MKQSSLKPYLSLFHLIQDAVRKQAKELPSFSTTNGSVRVTMVPQTKEADEWLGGASRFEERTKNGLCCVTTQKNDIVNYEQVFAIDEGCDFSTIFEYPSAMSKIVEVQIQKRSDDDAENAFSNFAILRVCVSGAQNVIDDSSCANKAIEAAKEFFDEIDFAVVAII